MIIVMMPRVWAVASPLCTLYIRAAWRHQTIVILEGYFTGRSSGRGKFIVVALPVIKSEHTE